MSDTFKPGVRLALDWGKARIGVAACDPAGMLAYPVVTLSAQEQIFARIVQLVAEYEPVELIVGLPLALDGTEQLAAQFVRAQIAQLARYLPELPIRFVDERLTTAGATRRLHEAGRSVKKQRTVIDQAAAVAILEQALAQL